MLSMLPFIIIPTMLSSPEWRDPVKTFFREIPWFVLPGYYVGILIFWIWWMNRPWPGDELLMRGPKGGTRPSGKAGDDHDPPVD
jgi:hypothetical protein